MHRLTRWIGLPADCVPAILTSTTLFGLVHVGKDPRELLLSLPGGVALAYIAYRTNSWLTVFVLHLATAGTAFLMIVAT
jgi:membrane protease YdiL (CAAX protease family)